MNIEPGVQYAHCFYSPLGCTRSGGMGGRGRGLSTFSRMSRISRFEGEESACRLSSPRRHGNPCRYVFGGRSEVVTRNDRTGSGYCNVELEMNLMENIERGLIWRVKGGVRGALSRTVAREATPKVPVGFELSNCQSPCQVIFQRRLSCNYYPTDRKGLFTAPFSRPRTETCLPAVFTSNPAFSHIALRLLLSTQN